MDNYVLVWYAECFKIIYLLILNENKIYIFINLKYYLKKR